MKSHQHASSRLVTRLIGNRLITLPQRVHDKITPTGEHWLWSAGKYTSGYGFIWDGIRQGPAHRYVYERVIGPIPQGLVLAWQDRTTAARTAVYRAAAVEADNERRAIRRGGNR